MTPQEELAQHLTTRPEIPRPVPPVQSKEYQEWRQKIELWLKVKADLESEIRRESIQKAVFHRMDPMKLGLQRSATSKADYEWRDIPKRRTA